MAKVQKCRFLTVTIQGQQAAWKDNSVYMCYAEGKKLEMFTLSNGGFGGIRGF